jgi:trk system potassium uptake protein
MRIIVVGCGRWGAALAKALSIGRHVVTMVDRSPRAFERLGTEFKGQTIVGNCFDREALLAAGIDRSDGLAVVTASDETNIVGARLASRVFRVPQVVARLNDPLKAETYRCLGIQTVTPMAWGVQRLTELLCYSELHVVQSFGGGEADLVEVEVPHALIGRAVQELTVPNEIQVTAITRNGRAFLPTLGTLLQEGDRLHLVVLASTAGRLKTLLGFG